MDWEVQAWKSKNKFLVVWHKEVTYSCKNKHQIIIINIKK
jgi:hypothetical protein